MERRDFLKRGALLGASLVAGPTSAADDGDGDDFGPPVFFLEGLLHRERLGDWLLWLSLTGSRAQGFAFDPATVDAQLAALRFEGRLRGNQLAMQLFALEDLNYLHPLGTLTGAGHAGLVQGNFALPPPATEHGTFQAQVIPVSEEESQRLAGIYQAVAEDAIGRKLYAATLILSAGHHWELRDIRTAPGMPAPIGGAARRLVGRYAVAADGRLLLNLTRVPLRFRQPAPAGGARPAGAGPEVKGSSSAAGGQAARVQGPQNKIHATAAPVNFTDGDFAAADWTAIKLRDTTPGQAATFEVQPSATGGDPGAYQQTSLNYQGGSADVAHVRDSFFYDPAASGPLDTLDFSYSLVDVDSTPIGVSAQYSPLVSQGDSSYIAGGADPATGRSWRDFTHGGLKASDFALINGSGPAHPDFSATGAPLHFGYLSLGPQSNRPASLLSGLDNYSVTVQPAGSTLTVQLTGPDHATIGDQVCLKATLQGDRPVAGQPVLLIGYPQQRPTVLVDKTTGPDGSATLCFTAPDNSTAGGLALGLRACWDLNGNGMCDADEPISALHDVRLDTPVYPPDTGCPARCCTAVADIEIVQAAGSQQAQAAAGPQLIIEHPFTRLRLRAVRLR
jgi:hypothetical protein